MAKATPSVNSPAASSLEKLLQGLLARAERASSGKKKPKPGAKSPPATPAAPAPAPAVPFRISEALRAGAGRAPGTKDLTSYFGEFQTKLFSTAKSGNRRALVPLLKNFGAVSFGDDVVQQLPDKFWGKLAKVTSSAARSGSGNVGRGALTVLVGGAIESASGKSPTAAVTPLLKSLTSSLGSASRQAVAGTAGNTALAASAVLKKPSLLGKVGRFAAPIAAVTALEKLVLEPRRSRREGRAQAASIQAATGAVPGPAGVGRPGVVRVPSVAEELDRLDTMRWLVKNDPETARIIAARQAVESGTPVSKIPRGGVPFSTSLGSPLGRSTAPLPLGAPGEDEDYSIEDLAAALSGSSGG